jgi:iduronate 2-sulfatase
LQSTFAGLAAASIPNNKHLDGNGKRNMIRPLLLLSLLVGFACPSQAADRPNIVFIAVDDLRPELGCYGSEIAITPNLDRLADDGLLFNRAYCQQAICRPSRASLMTGTRPETTGLFHNYVALRDLQPDILTLPQHFIANGYEAAYVGKIFHNGDTDDDRSWSREAAKWLGPDIERPSGPYRLAENVELRKKNFDEMFAKYGEAARQGLASGPAFEKADVPDHAYIDGYNTLRAIKTMKQMAGGQKPFFLGMGYHLPHLNWCAPKKYWDLYDPSRIPLIADGAAPVDGAAMGLHASFELRTRSNIPKYGPIERDLARTLKHAYLASTSYVDAQIGLLLKAVDQAGMRENTIIIVWGDHGWHLGDMGVWGKATNYEIATRVPLMIWTPTMKVRGAKTNALVELVDMFPTLCDLAEIAKPSHLEGHSFAPLLDDANRPWKQAVFSQYPNPALREWAANPLSQGMRETWFGPLIQDVERRIIDQHGSRWNRELFEQHLMGYTMRTDRYRLVLWRDRRDPQAEPIYVELFDHHVDPRETTNIAGKNPELVAELTEQLNTGWRNAL